MKRPEPGTTCAAVLDGVERGRHTVSELVEGTGATRNAVRSSLARLVVAGWIEDLGDGFYDLTFPDDDDDDDDEDDDELDDDGDDLEPEDDDEDDDELDDEDEDEDDEDDGG